jgi:thioredoxin 1
LKLKQNVVVVGTLIAIVIGFILIKGSVDRTGEGSSANGIQEASQMDLEGQQTKKLPMLVDLGKGTCIPCKKMKPILDELKAEYEGRAIVEVIDLRYDRQAARKYGIRLIPTQIFYDTEGNEVYRHQGFMDKQSIREKFAEMGVY